MPEPALSDPQLVQRIRELVADPDHTAPLHPPIASPGWVPPEPPSPTAPAESVSAAPEATTATAGWLPPSPPSPPAPTADPAALPPASRAPRVVTLPAFLRFARVEMDRRALLALVVVVVAAAVIFAARVGPATERGEPVGIDPNPSGRVSRSTPAGSSPAPAPSTPLPGSASSPPPALTAAPLVAPPAGTAAPLIAPPVSTGAPVHVHVVGQVASPRVVTLQAGSRVADAVTSAGGALPAADLTRVNLARLLADGEQVHVPAPGEAAPASPMTSAATATAGGLVDLNTADPASLDSLPGVGPVLAQRIVDWRAAHGRFSTVEELGEVSGIGDKLLTQLRPKVTVGGGARR